MKTAVSIPDEVFQRADELARRRHVSRSELYAIALRALLADDDGVTEQLNRVHGSAPGDQRDRTFTAVAGRRVFEQSDW